MEGRHGARSARGRGTGGDVTAHRRTTSVGESELCTYYHAPVTYSVTNTRARLAGASRRPVARGAGASAVPCGQRRIRVSAVGRDAHPHPHLAWSYMAWPSRGGSCVACTRMGARCSRRWLANARTGGVGAHRDAALTSTCYRGATTSRGTSGHDTAVRYRHNTHGMGGYSKIGECRGTYKWPPHYPSASWTYSWTYMATHE